MINAEISYGDAGYMASISGHACFAPKGQDIVCAGVSALTAALYKTASGFISSENAAYYSVEINEGCFEMRVLGIKDSESAKRLEMLFLMLFEGLFEIERQYPENLKLNMFEFPFGDKDNDTSEQTMTENREEDKG